MTDEKARVRAGFGILGPLRVVLDGTEIQVATRRQRALLVLLLIDVGRVVPTERLIDHLWDGAPPPQAAVTLRSYVSNLRQALGGKEGWGGAVVTRAQGYCLEVPREAVDAVRLRLLAERGRELLREGLAKAALDAFDEAVGLWRGDPVPELADHEAIQSTVAQLTETYLGAVEGRFEAQLASGRHADALAELERFTADHPLREEPHALLMLAFYRSGRAPEALDVHRRFRTLLQDELGIDPSARLDALHQQVLAQDPALDAPRPESPVATPITAPVTAPVAAPARRGPALVGREREQAALATHLDALVGARAGAVLLIGGEPGIGKTTLLEALEAAARERGVPVHAGRSPSASGAPAFWPWTQVVDSIADTLDDAALARATRGAAHPVTQLSAAVAARTGQLATLTGDDPQSVRFLLYEAVSTFVRQATGDSPVVIALDDVHWADLPSLELLSYLTPSLGGRPVLVAAAYRDLPADRTEALADTLATVSREDAAHELALGGLAPDDVATLTHDLVGTKQADTRTRERFATMLHDRTGGNPFFIRQLVRLMLESDTDPNAAVPPPGVRHVIASRLKVLPDATRDLLAAAAVGGREFDLRVTAASAGIDMAAALDAYDEAARHGLLEQSAGGGRRFVHALVQEVVLDDLPAGRAARLHAAVAAELRRGGDPLPEQLAEHLWAARDILGAEAVDAQVVAADASVAAFTPEGAETYLRRALQLCREGGSSGSETEVGVLLRLIRLLTSLRGWGNPEIRALVDRTLELSAAGVLDDTSVRLWWSVLFFLLDRDDPSYRDVVATLDAAVAAQREDDIGPASRAAIELGGVLAACQDDDRATARRRLIRARTLVEQAPDEALAAYDEHLHVMLLLIESYWAALHSDGDGHRRTVEAAVALADADGRPFPRTVARTLGAASATYLDDPAPHAEIARSALELGQRHGFVWLSTLAECLTGWAEAHAHGSPEAATDHVRRVRDQVTAGGHLGNLPVLNLMLADLLALLGHADEARETLQAARAQPGSYGGLMVDVVDRKLAALG